MSFSVIYPDSHIFRKRLSHLLLYGFISIFVLMRFRVIFVESQKWEMMIVNNDAFFASVIDLLRDGKRVTIPVKGTSMLPFIVAERDLVVLEGVEAASPAGKPRRLADRGDVVLFRFNNHYVLHRVLDFAAGGDAVIQGDGVLAAKEHSRSSPGWSLS